MFAMLCGVVVLGVFAVLCGLVDLGAAGGGGDVGYRRWGAR